jgi:serine/threonine-protein kinase
MDRRRARERDLERLNQRLTDQTGELRAAREALLDLNRTLEHRVTSQVEEILTRAQEIDALNAQLRVQVQERSRELAEALRRVSGRDNAARPLEPGTVLAHRVRLRHSLGRGGMGHVYLADDLLTGSRIAVKVLDPQISIGARDLQRFIDEAAAAAAIDHPAIVKTLHVDVADDGHPFLIMEAVNGITLKTLLADGALPPARCVAIGQVVASALAAAHRAGVVHRDIKPGNLTVCPEAPGVRVLDFGISKTVAPSNHTTWTQTRGVLGTPAYMSPEQFDNAETVTPASDVYSLGVVLFEMAWGSLSLLDSARVWPRSDGTDAAPYLMHDAPHVPAGFAALVNRCLQREPAARPSALEPSERLVTLVPRATLACGAGSGTES